MQQCSVGEPEPADVAVEGPQVRPEVHVQPRAAGASGLDRGRPNGYDLGPIRRIDALLLERLRAGSFAPVCGRSHVGREWPGGAGDQRLDQRPQLVTDQPLRAGKTSATT